MVMKIIGKLIIEYQRAQKRPHSLVRTWLSIKPSRQYSEESECCGNKFIYRCFSVAAVKHHGHREQLQRERLLTWADWGLWDQRGESPAHNGEAAGTCRPMAGAAISVSNHSKHQKKVNWEQLEDLEPQSKPLEILFSARPYLLNLSKQGNLLGTKYSSTWEYGGRSNITNI